MMTVDIGPSSLNCFGIRRPSLAGKVPRYEADE